MIGFLYVIVGIKHANPSSSLKLKKRNQTNRKTQTLFQGIFHFENYFKSSLILKKFHITSKDELNNCVVVYYIDSSGVFPPSFCRFSFDQIVLVIPRGPDQDQNEYVYSLLTDPFTVKLIPCSSLLVANMQRTSLKAEIQISFFSLAISNVLEYSTLSFLYVSVHCFSSLKSWKLNG